MASNQSDAFFSANSSFFLLDLVFFVYNMESSFLFNDKRTYFFTSGFRSFESSGISRLLDYFPKEIYPN